MENRLETVIDNYRSTVDKCLKEEHPKPPDSLSKQQLVDVSIAIHGEIVSQGATLGGGALDQLNL